MSPPPIKPIRFLIAQAAMHPAAAVGPHTHQSFPIPILMGSGLRMVFLYSEIKQAPGGTPSLVAPSYRAILEVDSGRLENLQAVTPAQLAQPHRAGEILGEARPPEDLPAAEIQIALDKLLDAYDVVLPYFAERDTAQVAPLLRAGGELKRLFPLLTERPLQPYYAKLGQGFFRWLDKVMA